MKIFISITSSTLFLAFLITIHAAKSQNLIQSTCQTSSKNNPNINYSFCTTSLQAAPASQCAALQGLGTISIRLVRYNVTDIRCDIKQLLKNEKWDPYVRQCLNDCFDLYSDAIPTVKLAMKYYNSERFDEANIQISSIMEAVTTCEEGFGEKEGVVSPLTKRNQDSFQLSAVALSVIRIIQAGSSARTNFNTSWMDLLLRFIK